MNFLQGLDYYHWFLLGLLLLVTELLLGGGFLVWLGFAALATGVLVLTLPWVYPGLSWQEQLLAFAVLSLLALLWWWRRFHWKEVAEHQEQALAKLQGREVILDNAIIDGYGEVDIDGHHWTITGSDLPSGSRVRLSVIDHHLVAEPIES